jgi:hypothetical protein
MCIMTSAIPCGEADDDVADGPFVGAAERAAAPSDKAARSIPDLRNSTKAIVFTLQNGDTIR